MTEHSSTDESLAHYDLVCLACGARHADDGFLLSCPRPHSPSFLRTEYTTMSLTPVPGQDGLFRYRRWLPVRRALAGAGSSITYRGERLGRALGLRELWIAFSGYWPERGAHLSSATFKELEAYTVLGRLPEDAPTLVVASAGNTAAAFVAACARHQARCVVVVPARALGALRVPADVESHASVVVLDGPADYADAITFAERLAAMPGFVAEGGARNVARRDGLGTAMLSAVERMGRLPDIYVQAVGSGSGAIAAHEAALRITDNTGRLPSLLLCQNLPLAPLHRAWRPGISEPGHNGDAFPIAPELVNRTPPYAIRGGVRDVLAKSGGDVLAVDNAAVASAMAMFQDLEGIDIEPAAAVAVAALCRHRAEGRVQKDAVVLLHVTGGGRAALAREQRLVAVAASVRVSFSARTSPDEPARVADALHARGPAGTPPAPPALATNARYMNGSGA